MAFNIGVPEALLTELKEIAAEEKRSTDELTREAVERYLRFKQREKLFAFGETRSRMFGVREADMPELIRKSDRTC